MVSKAVQSSNASTVSSQVQCATGQNSVNSFQPGGEKWNQDFESGVTNDVLFSQQFNDSIDWPLNDILGTLPPMVGNNTTATAGFENGNSAFEENMFPVLDETMLGFEDWMLDYSQPVIDSLITDNMDFVNLDTQPGIDDSHKYDYTSNETV